MDASAHDPPREVDNLSRDSVDHLLDSWATGHPELDFAAVDVITRLLRLRGHIEGGLHSLFRSQGLSAPDFTALVTLERAGAGGGVAQQRLAEELGLTAGTVSVRIDRLVEQGWATRKPDPASKRSTLVELTPAGRELFERVIPAHLANEDRMLSALSPDERGRLSGLLRKLLVEFEGSQPPPGTPTLGLVVAPSHVTIAMRTAVGLPPVTGLLVRSVAADSPAESAGFHPGDILVAAAGRPVRSTADVHAALTPEANAAPAAGVAISVLRGGERVELTVPRGMEWAGPAGRGGAAGVPRVRPGAGEHAL